MVVHNDKALYISLSTRATYSLSKTSCLTLFLNLNLIYSYNYPDNVGRLLSEVNVRF